ncbi:sucrose phosphorylase, partial [Fructilactobacillus sanfranciscensis]
LVAALLKLFNFRNNEAAFDLDGSIEITTPNENVIQITRMNKDKTRKARAVINLKNLTYQVTVNNEVINF